MALSDDSKKLIEGQKLTQQQLADKLYVSRRFVVGKMAQDVRIRRL